MRSKSTDDFVLKKLFKLLLNYVYGETMENKEKYNNFQLVVDARRSSKIRSSLNFVDRKIYNENTVGHLKRHTSMKLDKAMIFVILYFRYIKNCYGQFSLQTY